MVAGNKWILGAAETNMDQELWTFSKAGGPDEEGD